MIQVCRIVLLLPAVLVLISCNQPDKKLSGILVYGHEVRTVRLCGQSQVYWLHANQEQNRLLEDKVRSLSRQPYKELYLRFSGRMTEETPGEFAKEYDGTIMVESITDISAIIPDSCQ